jgi:hypothetical protein
MAKKKFRKNRSKRRDEKELNSHKIATIELFLIALLVGPDWQAIVQLVTQH